jgi:glyoxylase-like metal-dependent hydrolase (beta-lactamase superfamily II)
MSGPETYEVFAIRYAESPYRLRLHNCMFCHKGDVHDAPMPMDFYVWVVRNAHRTVIVDTGSKQWKCVQRGHEFIRPPEEGIRAVGVDPDKADDVVISHMHWDHAGNIEKFANANIHIQTAEMRNVTSQDMADPAMNGFFLVDDVCTVIRRLYEGRVSMLQGVKEIAPGITLHEVGGHSAGMQVVRVYTQRGWIVLAIDASHFYLNMRERNPFPALYNYQDTVKGWDTCLALAESPDHVVPGHDPLVLTRYPAASTSLAGDVVRLDFDPVA